MNKQNIKSKSETNDREDRNAHVTKETQNTILTTFDDTVDSQIENSTRGLITSAHLGSDPYTDQGLQEVLGRIYKVNTFSWSSTDTVGTQKALIRFPQYLFNNTILDRLVHFKYFRAAVEVTIKLNTTKFHSGLLQIAWLPHFNPIDSSPVCKFNPFKTMTTESRLPNMIMSANTQESVTFVIPYVAPSAYFDLEQNNAIELVGYLGCVSIRVLAALRCGQNVPSIDVSTYARFLEPQVAGPLHYQSEGTEMKTFSSNSPEDAVTHDYAKSTSYSFATADDQAESSDMTAEERVRSSDRTQSERRPASKPSKGQQVMTVIGKCVSKFVDVLPRFMTGAAALLPFLLDMPTSTAQHQPFVLRNGASLAPTKGLDNAIMLSMDPENKVANDPEIFCDQLDYNLFQHYKLLPSLIRAGTISDTKVSGDIVFALQVNPMVCDFSFPSPTYLYYPTHLATLSSLFRAWRGDIKYRFYFAASHFLSCRVRIEWLPAYTTSVTAETGEMMGNNINKVVDINGDTIVDFDIPYLQKQHWLVVEDFHTANNGVASNGSNGTVRLTILNKIVSANSTEVANIDYAMWISGGEDFELAFPNTMGDITGPGTYTFTYQSKEEPKGYFDTRSVFRARFPALVGARSVAIHGFENGESCSSFTEYMKRYTVDYINLPTPYTTVPAAVSAQQPNHTNPYYNFKELSSWDWNNTVLITRNFLFQRGSVRYKTIDVNQTTDPAIASVQPLGYNNHYINEVETKQTGTFFQNISINPVTEYQVPFWYPFPLYSFQSFPTETVTSPGFIYLNHNTNIRNIQTVRAVGDDYTLGWPLGCPSPITYTPP